MTGRTTVAALLAPAMVALGCGGGTAVTCGATQPCGGDLVGSWTVDGGCADPIADFSEILLITGDCPGVTVAPGTSAQTGSFTFSADMTFTGDLSFSRSYTATIPASCLGAMTCTELADRFTAATHTCTGDQTCSCAVEHRASLHGPGVYTILEPTFVELETNTGMNGWDFCATGSTLHFMQTAGGVAFDDILFTR